MQQLRSGKPGSRTLALALLLASGCAGMEAGRRSPGVISQGALSPSGPPSASYGPDATRTCPTGGAHQLLVDDLENWAKQNGKPVPHPDGRLCAAAEILLGWDRAEVPDENVMNFVVWYVGVPAPVPRVIVAPLETEYVKNISDSLRPTIQSFASNASVPRYGVATLRLRKDATRAVVVMRDDVVELDPVPRQLALNSQAVLSGRLAGPFEDPKVVVSDPTGGLETPSVAPGKSFRVELRCGAKAGTMWVEIRGSDKAEQKLASFPVGCGTELPISVAVAPSEGRATAQGPTNVSQQERALLERINAERTPAGLPALAWDESVASVAREISESRREEVLHGTKAKVDVAERLKSVELASPVVLLNPAQARTAEEAHRQFSTSPGHRSNYMSPAISHVGIGVAAATDKAGRSTVFVTELFVHELPPVDVEALRQKLRAAMVQKRADARAPAIAKDSTLEDVAQKYAKELAAAKGTVPKQRADEILAPVNKSYRGVSLLQGAKSDPLEFAEEPVVVSGGKMTGIGIAQGVHPALGKNAVYVVILMGTPAAAAKPAPSRRH